MTSRSHFIPSNAASSAFSPSKITAVVLWGLLTLSPAGASAEPFTIPFHLTLTISQGSEVLFGTTLPVGSTITGAWRFTTEMRVDDIPDPRHARYRDPSATLVLRSGHSLFEAAGPGQLLISNEDTSDRFFIELWDVPEFSYFFFGAVFGGDPSRFSSDAFPASVAAMHGMTGFGVLEATRPGYIAPPECLFCHAQVVLLGDARVTDAPIPEPSTLILFGTGTVALARFVRKRRDGA